MEKMKKPLLVSLIIASFNLQASDISPISKRRSPDVTQRSCPDMPEPDEKTKRFFQDILLDFASHKVDGSFPTKWGMKKVPASGGMFRTASPDGLYHIWVRLDKKSFSGYLEISSAARAKGCIREGNLGHIQLNGMHCKDWPAAPYSERVSHCRRDDIPVDLTLSYTECLYIKPSAICAVTFVKDPKNSSDCHPWECPEPDAEETQVKQ